MTKRNYKGGKGSRSVRKGSGKPKKNVPVFEGRVQMTREGFIFVIVDGQDDDIFVKASKTRNALDGDIVKVAVTRQADAKAASKAGGRAARKREGEVVEIVKRSGKQFVGILHTVGAQAWVMMQSKNMPYDIEVDAEEAAKLGAVSASFAIECMGTQEHSFSPSDFVQRYEAVFGSMPFAL